MALFWSMTSPIKIPSKRSARWFALLAGKHPQREHTLSDVAVAAIYSVVLQVKNWVKELKKMLGNDIALVICGEQLPLRTLL